ncbi:hypothetical protein N7492_004339 [Penicillium capsulatum]|uniref:Uncharacterized protein n=1 Tax=Penicillium capsulatum TaxID=69766 RepID=A0A9W9LQM8_9EURO|nr:hypothetical protein N7492_004339 [Penicillium capsulatum]KAJ6136543.1 hypothetical protein N7512_001703 [Penicillium capsulatum]
MIASNLVKAGAVHLSECVRLIVVVVQAVLAGLGSSLDITKFDVIMPVPDDAAAELDAVADGLTRVLVPLLMSTDTWELSGTPEEYCQDSAGVVEALGSVLCPGVDKGLVAAGTELNVVVVGLILCPVPLLVSADPSELGGTPVPCDPVPGVTAEEGVDDPKLASPPLKHCWNASIQTGSPEGIEEALGVGVSIGEGATGRDMIGEEARGMDVIGEEAPGIGVAGEEGTDVWLVDTPVGFGE